MPTSVINAKLLLASRNTHSGVPLYTFVLTYPRIILAEVNTHRMLSRNTASSRAIPSKKLRQRVLDNPFVPVSVGANQKGMQAGAELTGWRRSAALAVWNGARYPAVLSQYLLEKLGAHKQIANRLVEPWLWTEQIVTATDIKNLFKLRANPAAEPHFQILAKQMKALVEQADFARRKPNDGIYSWHLPFIDRQDRDEARCFALFNRAHTELSVLTQVSAARCARVSYYLNSKQVKPSIEEDMNLACSLSQAGHWSPFEHQATATMNMDYSGNLLSWYQLRKGYEGERGEQ